MIRPGELPFMVLQPHGPPTGTQRPASGRRPRSDRPDRAAPLRPHDVELVDERRSHDARCCDVRGPEVRPSFEFPSGDMARCERSQRTHARQQHEARIRRRPWGCPLVPCELPCRSCSFVRRHLRHALGWWLVGGNFTIWLASSLCLHTCTETGGGQWHATQCLQQRGVAERHLTDLRLQPVQRIGDTGLARVPTRRRQTLHASDGAGP